MDNILLRLCWYISLQLHLLSTKVNVAPQRDCFMMRSLIVFFPQYYYVLDILQIIILSMYLILQSEDGAVILSHWLSSANRTLTDDQYNTLMKVYSECSNPLFLQCAFHEAVSWTSYTPPENYKLAAAVKR